jgi:hypothetical protein
MVLPASESASTNAATELEAFRTIQYKMGSFFQKRKGCGARHIEHMVFHTYPPAKPSTACQLPNP